MDQSQARALAALQPFVHLATTTKSPSPRFVAELIKGAVSAPGTYIFTELLQTPAVQSLRGTESQSWLTLLEIFSWGTYEEYKSIPDLPQLDEAQTLKLRQLSLLTLASPFAPNLNETAAPTTNTLTYPSLLTSLSLPDAASLESLVTQSIYSGLLTGRLSPTSNPPVVNIVSVAPLRDLRPQSLPALLQILQTWESRCTSVVSELEAHISAIRNTAAERSAIQKKRQDVVDTAVLSTADSNNNNNNKASLGDDGESNAGGNKNNGGGGRSLRAAAAAHRLPSKRDLDQQMEGEGADVSDDEGRMDWDEGGGGDAGIPAGSSSRGGHGAGGGSRGAKRNRGRGSK